MLSLQGQFTFTADRPQLHCAAFFIGEPEEFITIHYDLVSIDCQGGDFLQVRRLAARSPSRGARERAWAGRCAQTEAAERGEPATLSVRHSARARVGQARSGTPTRRQPRPTPGRADGLEVAVILAPFCSLLIPGASKDLNTRGKTLCCDLGRMENATN